MRPWSRSRCPRRGPLTRGCARWDAPSSTATTTSTRKALRGLRDAEHLHAREPAQQCRPGDLGEFVWQAQYPQLDCIRGQFPGGAFASAGGEQQPPTRREPRGEPSTATSRGAPAPRCAARVEQTPLELSRRHSESFTRLMPLRPARVQDRRRAALRPAALWGAEPALCPAQPRARVPEPGGPDYGEAAQRPLRTCSGAAGARQASAPRGAGGGRTQRHADCARPGGGGPKGGGALMRELSAEL